MASIVRAPGNAEFFGAPGAWMRYGKDGALYVVATGFGPGYSDIGPIAFRVLPDGRSEWLQLEQTPPKAIAGFVMETDTGAEVFWFGGDKRSWVRVPLPGYVRRGLPDNVGQVPVTPAPSQPTQPTGPFVDEEGRKYTNDVKNRLMGEVARLDQRIDGLGSGGGISRHEAFQLAPDAVYLDIQRPESGIRGQIEAIARSVAPSAPQLNRAELKALVREVLLELINE